MKQTAASVVQRRVQQVNTRDGFHRSPPHTHTSVAVRDTSQARVTGLKRIREVEVGNVDFKATAALKQWRSA